MEGDVIACSDKVNGGGFMYTTSTVCPTVSDGTVTFRSLKTAVTIIMRNSIVILNAALLNQMFHKPTVPKRYES